ncbi:MAG: phosphoribosyl-ATP diphosphatase [Pseudomonadota bacterium]
MNQTLTKLADILEDRKQADPASSYVAALYAQGPDAILQKIGEEATEVVIAGKNQQAEQIICETADLWFHSLIFLAQQGLHPDQVLTELSRRSGQSGLAEKAARTT